MEELEIKTEPGAPDETEAVAAGEATEAPTATSEPPAEPVNDELAFRETAETPADSDEPAEPPAISVDELMPDGPNVAEMPLSQEAIDDAQLRAAIEAIIYVTEEPVTVAQMATALEQPPERIRLLINELIAEFERREHGLTIKEVASGYKMATKAEHHETVRAFVKSLKAPLKLSLPALETLAVVAYKQPVTAPEIMEIRGVQGAGVLKTLLDRKLIAAAGRKNVIGKPILYKTTKEFMVQFGLKDLGELPSLKEFEEIRRLSVADDELAPVDAQVEIPLTEVKEEQESPVPVPEPEQTPVEEPVAESGEQAPEEEAAEAEATAPEQTAEPAPEEQETAEAPEPGKSE